MWTVAQLNLVPIGGNVMTVVFVWVWAFASDYFQTRWLIVVAQCVSSPVALTDIGENSVTDIHIYVFFTLSDHRLDPLDHHVDLVRALVSEVLLVLHLVRDPRYSTLLLRLALRHVPPRRRTSKFYVYYVHGYVPSRSDTEAKADDPPAALPSALPR